MRVVLRHSEGQSPTVGHHSTLAPREFACFNCHIKNQPATPAERLAMRLNVVPRTPLSTEGFLCTGVPPHE